MGEHQNPIEPRQEPSLNGTDANAEPRFTGPELLAPAGDWDCARAAVENGADAIYFGLERFNARMRAQNFTVADLPSLMAFLHRRGVKGYVTFNTLVFADEIEEAEAYLRAIIRAGVDAVIVQDAGMCRLIRRLSPDFPIHASTQMTVTSAAGVEFAKELGCNLVVLARECSIREIEQIRSSPPTPKTAKSSDVGLRQEYRSAPEAGLDDSLAPFSKPFRAEPPQASPETLPLEVFIHGALCVAYSGQCLTSEALGGRSANRGECAQACRMPYDLLVDGQQVALGDRRYLLSPRDLAGLEVLPQLIDAGVSSLKIEGRLKSPEYVAGITRVYRQALDALAEGRSGQKGGQTTRSQRGDRNVQPGKAPPEIRTLDPRPYQYDLEMAFSRGLSTGWMKGINNQKLVHARFGKKRGVYLGQVTQVWHDQVLIDLEGPLKPGDGVVFDAGSPESPEEGGRIYHLHSRPRQRPKPASANPGTGPEMQSRQVALEFGRGDVDFSRVHPGDKVWKTSDPEWERRLRHSFAGTEPRFRRPIEFEVRGQAGQPMTVIVRDEGGHLVRLRSIPDLAPAETQPLTAERLREQFGRLGGTPFTLGRLVNLLEGSVILPVSELNRLRRQAVEQLELRRTQPRQWTLRSAQAWNPPQSELELQTDHPVIGNDLRERVASSPATSSELIALVRTLPQLEAALAGGITTLYCEFEDPKRYREAVRTFRESSSAPHPLEERNPGSPVGARTIWVAPPRIFKNGENWILKTVRSSEADGYLIRNHEQLRFFSGCRRIGDFSLNVANPLTAEYLMERYGLERLTASYDLNMAQLAALLRTAPPAWLEITIHQHMPLFHMEHCVFCAFLSEGTDYTNCGRPCDKHRVKLRDRVGAEHVLKADAGCRNTVFQARAQSGAEYVAHMQSLGARHFRIEFVEETPEETGRIVNRYQALLSGAISGAQLWRELKLLNQLGVTRGQMERPERRG
jgi:U32 family peptidase